MQHYYDVFVCVCGGGGGGGGGGMRKHSSLMKNIQRFVRPLCLFASPKTITSHWQSA